MADEHPFESRAFDSLEAALAFANANLRRGWIFRGQRCSRWNLQTSLERAAAGCGLAACDLRQVERDLIYKFTRNIHLHIPSPPDEDETLEILALMQHHGAPTRLLDWTYSVYVAAFFAFEAISESEECAIWALHYRWCNAECARLLSFRESAGIDLNDALQDPKIFRGYFSRSDEVPLVLQITPRRLSQRLIIQQGTFLWPGSLTKTFMENVACLPNATSADNVVELRIRATIAERVRALELLHRMNMSRATLFPGLDGFAASFHTELPFNWRKR